MVFYVDRRAHVLQYANQAYNLTRLPTALAGFERINTDPIALEYDFNTGSSTNADKYCLRSVVIADILDDTNITNNNNDPRKVVVSSSTYVFQTEAISPLSYNPDGSIRHACDEFENIYHYSPSDVMTRQIGAGSPIYEVPYNTATAPTPEFEVVIKKCETQGIIFIYQNYNFLSSQQRVITY